MNGKQRLSASVDADLIEAAEDAVASGRSGSVSALLAGRVPITHGGVVGQVWRGGSGRQANLTQLLPALDIASLDATMGRRAGALLVEPG